MDGTPSRGKQAQLAARPDPQAVSPSEPRLVCVECGGLVYMLTVLSSVDEPSWLGTLWLGLALRCIPSLM